MQTPTEILSSDGPIAAMLGGSYEARDEQLRMATAVAGAMESGGRLLAEAGTGVGKSFAYLVPAIERCVRHGETVVVATNTIALQEQLVRKDVPMLQRALGLPEIDAESPSEADPTSPVRPALVKGRGNYVSLRRLELASKRQDRLFPDAASRGSLHVIEDWARDTREGSRSSLPQLERPGVWDRMQSDSANCMGRKCPNNDICFYQRARRKMERSNLLICNHALFFSDLALRSRGVGFLPRYDHVILDEAHMVEDVASEHFGVSLSEGKVNHLLRALLVERGLKGYLPQLALGVKETPPVEAAMNAVREARDASGAFFESLLVWSDQNRGGSGGRVREQAVVDNILSPVFRELATRLRLLKEIALQEADRFELNAYAERATDIADAADVLVEQSLEGCAYWVEVSRSQSRRDARVSFACSPIEVGPILRTHLFERGEAEDSPLPKSVVLTSATLTTRAVSSDEPVERAETAFSHVIGRLGCEGAGVLQLGSPFDHGSQAELIVDTTMPSPRGPSGGASAGAASFHDELARRVLEHIEATDGGAFVLFTSFAALYAVADAIHHDLLEQGMPMLAQGRDGPRSLLLDRFREDQRSVLLGAASFWQGVDVQGEGLRNVIITRLPFDPPDRPLTEARLEHIRERGGDPFREESLPRAVIRFKQGFGRLIRSKTDRGRVVVLDPRILMASYGKRFLAALPEGVPIRRIDEASGP